MCVASCNGTPTGTVTCCALRATATAAQIQARPNTAALTVVSPPADNAKQNPDTLTALGDGVVPRGHQANQQRRRDQPSCHCQRMLQAHDEGRENAQPGIGAEERRCWRKLLAAKRPPRLRGITKTHIQLDSSRRARAPGGQNHSARRREDVVAGNWFIW